MQLHPYQKDAVKWMMYVEDTCHKRMILPSLSESSAFQYSTMLSWDSAQMDIFADAEDEDRIYTMTNIPPKARQQICFFGGVLADEMGLGKTRERNRQKLC